MASIAGAFRRLDDASWPASRLRKRFREFWLSAGAPGVPSSRPKHEEPLRRPIRRSSLASGICVRRKNGNLRDRMQWWLGTKFQWTIFEHSVPSRAITQPANWTIWHCCFHEPMACFASAGLPTDFRPIRSQLILNSKTLSSSSRLT